ncbi:hypothetical protein [Pseudonocardia humida]|uniref:Uncharacterized protein n=1 Tax=Pseudonocardia humida TaxID=2800819 RepID=A0ABT1A363_9PSEU|nr:hypothetical protein [Pseudonocardia humida]MCO1657432.1 hypothetical protein [Pseudonocardia humida]
MIEIFTRPEQHWFFRVVGFIIRRRAELTVITVTVIAWTVCVDQFGQTHTVIGMTVTVLVVFAVPASRRFVIRRMWCVITRHRMRACFKRTRGAIHHGKLPYLWWSRPSPVGERVRVWLPAGLSVKDVQHITDELATACWAREARITPSRSQAASVVIDIVRRDPLGRSKPVTPTVADGLDASWHHDHGGPQPLPDRTTVAAPGPIPVPAPRPASGSSTNGHNGHKRPERRTPPDPGEHAPEPEVAGFGGVDVSDYI